MLVLTFKKNTPFQTNLKILLNGISTNFRFRELLEIINIFSMI